MSENRDSTGGSGGSLSLDEAAEQSAAAGKFLGVEYVITGQLVNTGGAYRTVRNGWNFRSLVSALKKTKYISHAAKYGVTEDTKPQTAGTFLDRAIADYTQTIRLDPNNAGAYYNRGIAYYNKGDYDRAIADYTQAIRLDPNNDAAYYNRGNAYFNKDGYDRAVADYTEAVRLNPDNQRYKDNLENARRERDR